MSTGVFLFLNWRLGYPRNGVCSLAYLGMHRKRELGLILLFWTLGVYCSCFFKHFVMC